MDFRIHKGSEADSLDPEGVGWPSDAVVLYAIDEQGVAGRAALIPLPHIEGTWVREDKRGGMLAYRLVTKLEQLVAADGRSYAVAFCLDAEPEIAEKLAGVHYERLPLSVWAKKVKED